MAVGAQASDRSMRHGVEENIDRHRVADSFGETAKEVLIFTLPLPAISKISIEAGEHHEPIFIVKERAEMDVFARFAHAGGPFVNFPRNSGFLRAAADHHVRHLK